MDLFAEHMKCEAWNPLPQFCNACFSADRKLSPVGMLLEVFQNLFENKGLNLVFQQEVTLCWECLAFLKRVEDFKRNVMAVQNFMYNYHCNESIPLPSSLSKLVKATTYDINVEYEVKLENGAKVEVVPQNTMIKKEEPGPSGVVLKEIEIDMKKEVQDDDYKDNDDDDGWLTSEPNIKDEESQPFPKNMSKKRKKQKRQISKYIKHAETSMSIQKFFTKVKLNDADLFKLLEQDRKDKLFLELPYRCEKCVCGWADEHLLLLHNKTRHSKNAGFFECHICTSRIEKNNAFQVHLKSHYVERRCNKCDYRTVTQTHMRRHVMKYHLKSMECRMCGASFHSTREFSQHYKKLHQQYICDHCGRTCLSRQSIKKHLLQHGPYICCKRQFKSLRALQLHRARHHVRCPPELAYCVECDRQFDSVYDLKTHLRTTVKHRQGKQPEKKQVPCPDCGKVYARRTYMLYHYNFVHLKRSNYQCQECDTYFLNRTHYKNHMRSKHEPGWQAPKNKICTVCGRGFTQNTVLVKHMRTHTGERPYACTYCDAKFSQNCALQSHVKHIHLKERRQPSAQLRASL